MLTLVTKDFYYKAVKVSVRATFKASVWTAVKAQRHRSVKIELKYGNPLKTT